MAHIPTETEVKELQQKSNEAIEKKTIKQHLLGKEFVLDEFGHSSGVIPETVWENLPGKKLDNPEATK